MRIAQRIEPSQRVPGGMPVGSRVSSVLANMHGRYKDRTCDLLGVNQVRPFCGGQRADAVSPLEQRFRNACTRAHLRPVARLCGQRVRRVWDRQVAQSRIESFQTPVVIGLTENVLPSLISRFTLRRKTDVEPIVNTTPCAFFSMLIAHSGFATDQPYRHFQSERNAPCLA